MTSREKIDKILKIKQLKIKNQNDFAMKCGINPNTLTVAINRDALSDDIITKIHDKFGVAKEFLEDGIEPVLENVEENGQDVEDVYRKVIEGTEYYIIPRAVLKENYRLVALESFQKEKEERDQEKIDAAAQTEKDRISLEAHIEASREFARQLAVVITKLADANILIAKLTEMQIRQK